MIISFFQRIILIIISINHNYYHIYKFNTIQKNERIPQRSTPTKNETQKISTYPKS